MRWRWRQQLPTSSSIVPLLAVDAQSPAGVMRRPCAVPPWAPRRPRHGFPAIMVIMAMMGQPRGRAALAARRLAPWGGVVCPRHHQRPRCRWGGQAPQPAAAARADKDNIRAGAPPPATPRRGTPLLGAGRRARRVCHLTYLSAGCRPCYRPGSGGRGERHHRHPSDRPALPYPPCAPTPLPVFRSLWQHGRLAPFRVVAAWPLMAGGEGCRRRGHLR